DDLLALFLSLDHAHPDTPSLVEKQGLPGGLIKGKRKADRRARSTVCDPSKPRPRRQTTQRTQRPRHDRRRRQPPPSSRRAAPSRQGLLNYTDRPSVSLRGSCGLALQRCVPSWL